MLSEANNGPPTEVLAKVYFPREGRKSGRGKTEKNVKGKKDQEKKESPLTCLDGAIYKQFLD